jgi:hypothetical protein
MAKKIMDHPILHSELETIDRIIFLILGVLITLFIFKVMNVI